MRWELALTLLLCAAGVLAQDGTGAEDPAGAGAGAGGAAGGAPRYEVTEPSECKQYPCLIFEELFEDLDLKTWEHEITASGNGNWEFQTYTNNRSNSFVKEDKLYIKPTLTDDQYGEDFVYGGSLDLWGGNGNNDDCTGNQFFGCYREGPGFNPQTREKNPGEIINPVKSARLRTKDSFAFKYGHIDVTAKMPKGDWLWPAVKLIPKYTSYGKWPASGEIDIIESRGNFNITGDFGQALGAGVVQSTLHWGPYWQANGFFRTIAGKPLDHDGFHKYGVTWTKDFIKFYIDNQPLMEINPETNFFEFGMYEKFLDIANPWSGGTKMAPFDQEFYLAINLAVGGTNGYFSDLWTYAPTTKPWANLAQFPMRDFWEKKEEWYPTWQGDESAFVVDSIRVWKIEED